MSVRQLRASSEGRLPDGTTLSDVWQTLVEMHAGESDVLGLLHSLGYVRGLQNSLCYPEQRRVEALVRCATRATCAARHTWFKGTRLAWQLKLSAWRVYALFLFLRVASVFLRCLQSSRMPIKRVKPE